MFTSKLARKIPKFKYKLIGPKHKVQPYRTYKSTKLMTGPHGYLLLQNLRKALVQESSNRFASYGGCSYAKKPTTKQCFMSSLAGLVFGYGLVAYLLTPEQKKCKKK